ncbi:zinc finger BED domain-containing protein 5-like [Palaemon carinicauda]|uniref:zinc finger BED domain-containing protein 5-like n=1 Tax=Palaemon carinicauda TaxID=392227 RepID=UPI0035B63F90
MTKKMASKNTRKRAYSEAFLQYGFVNMPDCFGDRPKCVLCCKVLINESLKPGKLKEHLMKCHPGSASQSIKFFQQKAINLQAVKFGKTGLASQQLAAAVEASYEVAYRIAKTQKPHTVAEELILPFSIIMVEKLCGLHQAKILSAISLSNNTIRRKIDDLAADIHEQFISEVLSSSYPKFSMQFDKSTDIASWPTLIGFIRYVREGSIKEEMLLYEDLSTTTKCADIFNTVDGFLRKEGLD